MASSATDLTSRLLRRERWLLAGAIFLLAALGWTYLIGAQDMASMHPPLPALVLMWFVMMVAMMLPSAIPAILLYAQVRRARGADAAMVQPWVFLAGYLGVWLLFSSVAALVEWALESASARFEDPGLQGVLLLAAGAYQLSPLKSACANQCRSPAQFISRHWRSGWTGAVRLGMLHGAYCVGCCWLLMALLFVGGVMNLLWVVGLTILVAGEKLLPNGKAIQIGSGIALILWGGAKFAGF